MRIKTAITAVILLLVLSFLAPAIASSEETLWAEVSIDEIYYNANGWCTVRLTEVSNVFEYKLFRAKNENSKAILAIFLTAQSMQKNVRIAFYDGEPASQIILAGMVNK